MLTIRKEQMDVFSERLTREFAAEAQPRIAEQLAASGIETEPRALTETIYQGCLIARTYYIRGRLDLERFIVLVLKRWTGFSDGQFSRPLLSILMAYGMDAGVKLDRFEAALEKEAPRGRSE